MDTEALIRFAAVAVALYGLHDVADHWIQRHSDAMHKGDAGWSGRLHCLSHVASYGATQAAGLAALWLIFGLELRPVSLVAGMLVNLGTHYLADRRVPLRRLAEMIPGKAGFWNYGSGLGTGAYALDQSWHKGWMFISALVIAI